MKDSGHIGPQAAPEFRGAVNGRVLENTVLGTFPALSPVYLCLASLSHWSI